MHLCSGGLVWVFHCQAGTTIHGDAVLHPSLPLVEGEQDAKHGWEIHAMKGRTVGYGFGRIHLPAPLGGMPPIYPPHLSLNNFKERSQGYLLGRILVMCLC